MDCHQCHENFALQKALPVKRTTSISYTPNDHEQNNAENKTYAALEVAA